jgi:hypothetical protein
MMMPLTEQNGATNTTQDSCARDLKRESQRNRKMRFSKNGKRNRQHEMNFLSPSQQPAASRIR